MSGVIDHANVTLKFDILQLSTLDLGTADFPVTADWSVRLGNGIAAGQASQCWTDTRTLGPSATESLDLAGVLVNAFGVAVTFAKLKLIAVRASPLNNVANAVNVLRGASAGVPAFTAAGAGVPLGPGAWFVCQDPTGIVVTPATADILTVTNSAGVNPVSYDVLLLGTD